MSCRETFLGRDQKCWGSDLQAVVPAPFGSTQLFPAQPSRSLYTWLNPESRVLSMCFLKSAQQVWLLFLSWSLLILFLFWGVFLGGRSKTGQNLFLLAPSYFLLPYQKSVSALGLASVRFGEIVCCTPVVKERLWNVLPITKISFIRQNKTYPQAFYSAKISDLMFCKNAYY